MQFFHFFSLKLKCTVNIEERFSTIVSILIQSCSVVLQLLWILLIPFCKIQGVVFTYQPLHYELMREWNHIWNSKNDSLQVGRLTHWSRLIGRMNSAKSIVQVLRFYWKSFSRRWWELVFENRLSTFLGTLIIIIHSYYTNNISIQCSNCYLGDRNVKL